LTIEPTQLDASVSKKPLGGDCGCRARSIQEVLFEGEGRLTTAARAQITRRKSEEMLVQRRHFPVF
jgi:hypothetical protein